MDVLRSWFSATPFSAPGLSCLALAGLISLSGCRWGNNLVNAPTPPCPVSGNPADPYSGCYETKAQTLQFCVTHTTTSCVTVDPAQVLAQTPAEVSNVMTDPVAFAITDLQSGSAAFLAAPLGSASGSIPVTFQASDQSLSFNGSSQPAILWTDPACTTTLYLSEQGKLLSGQGPSTSGTTLPLSGQVQVTIQMIRNFAGTCTQTMQDISSCYLNAANCGGSSASDNQALQAQVQAMFAPYISAGAMAVTDIPNVSNLAYEVSYQ